ncbi:galactose mutarotase-like protein [Agrocybe pediades]|nr:galactose mutarotase-like protein [Agrocybe pediades]
MGKVQDPAWPFDLTEIKAPDGSITAKFVSFGSTMTELWVKDRDGKARDVILGYDDNSKLLTDPAHPVFNPIVGRYANRIKNGTFSIPISKNPDPKAPNTYHIPTNDQNGQVTLHGGIYGWDRRNWTLVDKSPSSVTYMHVDDADEGFPGTVAVFATHTVSNGGILRTRLRASASQKTPIMLTQHIYWNLDAFQDGNNDIYSHNLRLASSRTIEVDDIAIPTGKFLDVTGTPSDFRKGEELGARWNETVGLCGTGCQGYNNGWVLDDPNSKQPAVTLKSESSGIRVDITTNQPVVIVYTSFWLNTPRKEVHGGPSLNYGPQSAVAIEQQGYIAAINTPEWHIDQIYYPGKDYEWSSEYKFSNF